MTKARLIVMCGLPGSGKSTWAAAYASQHGGEVVSVDAIRDGANEVATFNRARARVHAAFKCGARVVVADACSLRVAERNSWRRIGEMHGATCELVIMMTPLKACMMRRCDTMPARTTRERQQWDKRWELLRATARDAYGERWAAVTRVEPPKSSAIVRGASEKHG